MTLVSWFSTNARAIAKVGLYLGGGLCLGSPLIAGAKAAYDGKNLDEIKNTITWDAIGYQDQYGVVPSQLRKVVIRDAAGVAAILIGRKL